MMFLMSSTRKNLLSRPGSPFVFSIWVLATLLVFICNPAFSAESEIQQLAAEAKQRFSRVMQPPIFENPLVTHAFFLESTASHRDYVVKSFDEAIDALVAEADRQERMPVVASALRDLIKHGETETIDHVFAEMLERALADNKMPNLQAAAVLRHSVALVELPIALQATTFPVSSPLAVSPFVSLTLNGAAYSSTSGMNPMPGPKTLPAYRKAVELDPGHLWTWIVIASLAQRPQDFENALARAEEIAQASDDRHGLVFVKLELGRLENKFKLSEKATQAYEDAVNTASKGLVENPADDAWKHDLGSAFMGLGPHFDSTKFSSKEHAEAVNLLEKAVGLRSQLAANHPENPRLSLELATAYMRLSNAHRRIHRLLSGKDEDSIESKRYRSEAEKIYNALTASDSLKPTLRLNTGVFASVLMQAGGLTLTMGFVLIFLYRRRIVRWMREASSAKTVSDTSADQATGQTLELAREIEFAWLPSKARSQGVSFTSAQMITSHQHFRRGTRIYVLGGVAFALIAAILTLTLGNIEITSIRLLAFSLNYAWPIVLTLWLLWGPDRKRLAVTLFVYFGILLAVCVRVAFSDTTALKVWGIMVSAFYQPLIAWILAVFPSLFLLLFLNRHIRAVGPVLLVLMMALITGSTLMLFIGSSPGGMKAFFDLSYWLEHTTGISLSDNLFWWLQILGALLIFPIGVWLVRGLCQSYKQKRYSELTLIIDSIWLFETGNLCISLSNEEGQGYWLVLAAFAIYKIVTYLGLRSLAQDALRTAPARLLLLRVFGFKRRSEHLFKLLEAHWRYVGPIQLIAAPDLASSTADPGDFMSFITGNLRNQFIIEPSDIGQRLANMDYASDPDGRYRVNEVFCGNDAWRPVVQQLMIGSDLVTMDLRGFSVNNQGCLFELQALVDYVPFDRMVLLVDDKTDTGLLSQTLTARWQQTNSASPNAQGTGIISILKVGKWDAEAIDTLLEVADERLSGTNKSTTSKLLPLHAAN
jgi:tetratricopeptide (TPR) repeat protein